MLQIPHSTTRETGKQIHCQKKISMKKKRWFVSSRPLFWAHAVLLKHVSQHIFNTFHPWFVFAVGMH